jgi:TATA-binding protein-associated factor
VQNKVHELWAAFDFLMPNFLGTSNSFAREFARPILKSQLPGASASSIAEGLERLKTLHQQVLPFILRREKSEVLRELPPKVVSYVKVPMSDVQARLYWRFCGDSSVQASLEKLEDSLEPPREPKAASSVDTEALKSLLILRLLCTHPILIAKDGTTGSWRRSDLYSLDVSGKLLALVDMLRNSDIVEGGVTAADNDTSLLYCDDTEDDETVSAYNDLVQSAEDAGLGPEIPSLPVESTRKCIIFAQFTKTLDLVEELVFQPLMPSLRYLRLDGRVPAEKRSELANRFNCDPTIKVFLATTRVGGLGLNLTGT